MNHFRAGGTGLPLVVWNLEPGGLGQGDSGPTEEMGVAGVISGWVSLYMESTLRGVVYYI